MPPRPSTRTTRKGPSASPEASSRSGGAAVGVATLCGVGPDGSGSADMTGASPQEMVPSYRAAERPVKRDGLPGASSLLRVQPVVDDDREVRRPDGGALVGRRAVAVVLVAALGDERAQVLDLLRPALEHHEGA